MRTDLTWFRRLLIASFLLSTIEVSYAHAFQINKIVYSQGKLLFLRESGELPRLLAKSQREVLAVAFSKNGSRIAFVDRGEPRPRHLGVLKVLDLNGASQLSVDLDAANLSFWEVAEIRWLNSKIIEIKGSQHPLTGAIALIDVEKQRVLPDFGTSSGFISVSPLTSRVANVRNSNESGETLFVDDREVRGLANKDIRFLSRPTWEADERRIAIAWQTGEEGVPQLSIIDAASLSLISTREIKHAGDVLGVGFEISWKKSGLVIATDESEWRLSEARQFLPARRRYTGQPWVRTPEMSERYQVATGALRDVFGTVYGYDYVCTDCSKDP